MKTLSIHETKTHMSRLLHEVDKGVPIVFGARGHADYQIVKFKKKPVDRSRAFGAWKDKIWVDPDAFNPETDKLIAEILTSKHNI